MHVDLSADDLEQLVGLVSAKTHPGLRNRLMLAWCAATLQEAGVDENDPRIALMRTPTHEITSTMVEAANATAKTKPRKSRKSQKPRKTSDDAAVTLPAWPTNELPASPPFGWRIEANVVVADRNEHLVMKYLLLGKRQGLSYQQVADDLNGRRLRNRKNRRWTSSSISRVHRVSCAHEANVEWVNRWA